MVSQDGANGSKTGVNGSKTGVNGCKRLPSLSFQIQRHIWLTVSILSLRAAMNLTVIFYPFASQAPVSHEEMGAV